MLFICSPHALRESRFGRIGFLAKVLIGIKKTVNRCDSKKSDFLQRSSFDDCYAVFMRLRC